MNGAAKPRRSTSPEVPSVAMAPRSTGMVLERRRGGTIVFALRFRAYGKRRYMTLGSKRDGWTRQKAEEEL